MLFCKHNCALHFIFMHRQWQASPVFNQLFVYSVVAAFVLRNVFEFMNMLLWSGFEASSASFSSGTRMSPYPQSQCNCDHGSFFVLYSVLLTEILSRSRSADLWENPNVFDPDRFNPSRPDYKRKIAQLQTFGGGSKVCIGRGTDMIPP